MGKEKLLGPVFWLTTTGCRLSLRQEYRQLSLVAMRMMAEYGRWLSFMFLFSQGNKKPSCQLRVEMGGSFPGRRKDNENVIKEGRK